MTENDFIKGALLDEQGKVLPELHNIFRSIDYVGYAYKHINGATYYMDASLHSWAGLGDTEGHYAYVRYTRKDGGHQKRENTVSVWLTMALALPNCGAQAVDAGLLLMDFIKEARWHGAKAVQFSQLRSNRVDVWVDETGMSADKVRTDISMIAFDFELQYPAPDACNIQSFTCKNC